MPDPQDQQDAIALGRQNAAKILERRQAALERRASALHARSARLQAAAPEGATPSVAPLKTAGNLLALGDSWFDYPFHDVLKELEDGHGFTIQSTAKAGDPIESMAYHGGQLDNFARALEKITDQGNVPKAILLSGGGDDIAGKEFGMLINNALSKIGGWAPGIIDYVLSQRILRAYQTIVTTVTELCRPAIDGQAIPILIHGYDYPVPDGRGFLGGWLFLPGPWLEPGFREKLFFDLPTTTAMMKIIIDQFNAMLSTLVADPAFSNVRYIDLRGTLSNNLANDEYKQWWANELHPTEQGFRAVADKFAAYL